MSEQTPRGTVADLAALARAKGGAMQDAAERALWWAHDQRLAALQESGQ